MRKVAEKAEEEEVKEKVVKKMHRVVRSQVFAARLAEPTKLPEIANRCRHQQEWGFGSPIRERKKTGPRAIKPGQRAATAATTM